MCFRMPAHLLDVDREERGAYEPGMKHTLSSDPARARAEAGPVRRHQAGALCWRERKAEVEILLITTRRTGRWTPPKGGLIEGKSEADSAVIEAWEEAGAKGILSPKPLGSYHYLKFRDEDEWERTKVKMFALRVTSMAKKFPELGQRELTWVTQAKAADMVEEAELQALIAGFRP